MNKYDTKFMNSAIQWSEYSYCKRKQVGAILVKDGREIASGYNGTISGSESNECEDYYYECPHCEDASSNYNDIFIIRHDKSTIDDSTKILLYCKEFDVYLEDIQELDDVSEYKHSVSKDSVIHAERNIIAYCAKHGISTNGCTMYITLSPCQGCAVLMAQAGITKVIYKDTYKDTIGIKILKEAGIDIKQYKEDT